MGKLESNKKKKEDALYNTAFELFTTKGTNKTTISDIVEKAGVANGNFYLYLKINMISETNWPLPKTQDFIFRCISGCSSESDHRFSCSAPFYDRSYPKCTQK